MAKVGGPGCVLSVLDEGEMMRDVGPKSGDPARPEDLLRLERDGRFELVDGRLLVLPTKGAEASLIGTRLICDLFGEVRSRRLGIVLGARCGYHCFPVDRSRVRYVSGSFLRRGRPGPGRLPSGHLEIAPGLIVEVVAPEERAEILDERITDFLRGGTSLAWVVSPMTRSIQVYRLDGSGTRIGPDGVLDGEDVLPGFSYSLLELFSVIDGDPEPVA